MFRAMSGKSMLFAVLIWLSLCSVLCWAKPMGVASSRPLGANLAKEPAVIGREDAPYKVKNLELEAQVQSRVFYKSYPILDTLTTDPKVMDYARKKYGAVWLRQPNLHSASPSFVFDLYKDGKPAVQTDHALSTLLQEHMNRAREVAQHYGDAAKLLAYGPPFKSRSSRIYFWDQVWNTKHVVPIPAHKTGAEWLEIRKTLQENKRILLHDPSRETLMAFRLDRLGNVEMDVKQLAHSIKKRSNQVSDKPDPLGKRMYVGSSLAYTSQTDNIHPYQYYVGPRARFQYRQPTRALTEKARQQMFADTIYHDGAPILVGGQVFESKVQHAFNAHRHIWLTTVVPGGEPQEYQPPVRLSREGRFDSHGAERASARLAEAAAARAEYGHKLMYLKYGMPFAPRQSSRIAFLPFGRKSYSKPDWKKVDHKGTTFNLAETDIYRLRQHLDQHNFLKAEDNVANKVWGLRLDAAGQVEIKDLTARVHALHKRTDSDARRYIETYLVAGVPEDPRLRPLSDTAKGRFYADHLHIQGEPVFFPATDPHVFSKVKQAKHDYRGYWIVGSPIDNPGLVTATRVDSVTRATARFGSQDVVRNVQHMQTLSDPAQRNTILLEKGPPFPRRKTSLFKSYKTPSWDKVRAKAPRIAINEPMADKWELLHTHNMLVVSNEHVAMGYALDKSGQVLHHIL